MTNYVYVPRGRNDLGTIGSETTSKENLVLMKFWTSQRTWPCWPSSPPLPLQRAGLSAISIFASRKLLFIGSVRGISANAVLEASILLLNALWIVRAAFSSGNRSSFDSMDANSEKELTSRALPLDPATASFIVSVVAFAASFALSSVVGSRAPSFMPSTVPVAISFAAWHLH